MENKFQNTNRNIFDQKTIVPYVMVFWNTIDDKCECYPENVMYHIEESERHVYVL